MSLLTHLGWVIEYTPLSFVIVLVVGYSIGTVLLVGLVQGPCQVPVGFLTFASLVPLMVANKSALKNTPLTRGH